MPNTQKFIDDFNRHSPFEHLFQHGIKPEEIKGAIIKSFSPYFKNKQQLEKIAMTHLVVGWVNFMLFQRDAWAKEQFEKLLQLYNNVKEKNSELLFNTIVDLLPDIAQTITRFWSIQKLETSKDDLENDEYLEACLSLIGQIIEGLTKTYIKLTLILNRINTGKKFNIDSISEFDLGLMIDELIRHTDFPDLLCPPPWSVRLNQWRNIAYHHTAKVSNNDFIMTYGKGRRIKSITLTKEELWLVTKRILSVYNAFRNAELVILFDNLEEYQDTCRKREPLDLRLRNEVKYLELCTGINSQGFRILELIVEENSSKLILQDMFIDDVRNRACHASMFLYHLWMATEKDDLYINYHQQDGTLILKASVKGHVCKLISDGQKTIGYLAEKAVFDFINCQENL